MRSKNAKPSKSRDPIQRISISLPRSVFEQIDRLVEKRGLENRSKAIAEMIGECSIEFDQRENGDTIMAGTITLVYDDSRGKLLAALAELQRQHIAEVISSLHVQLEHGHRMEVLLVQGPAKKLRRIADELSGCKGVKTSKLTLTNVLLPPLHQP